MKLGIDTYIFPNKKVEDIDAFYWKYNTVDLDQMTSYNNYRDKITWVYNAALHNIKTVGHCLKWCAKRAKYGIGVYRLPNNIIPGFLYRPTSWYVQYHLEDLQPKLLELGNFARKNKIRLTFHAPMTTVLNSINSKTVSNSLFTISKLLFLYESMGYDLNRFHSHGCTICTHVGGREGGLENLANVLQTVDDKVLNVLAIENDDKIYSAEDLLNADLPVSIILDTHHNWCLTGNYIKPKSHLFKSIAKTWKHSTPIIHASMPRYEYCKSVYGDVEIASVKCRDLLPNKALLEAKCGLNNLRPHSKTIYSHAFKNYIKQFLKVSDVMIEAQYCNLATLKLGKFIKRSGK